MTDIKSKYQGKKFTVVHCKDALKSFENALQGVNANRRNRFTEALILQIKRLANEGPHKMSKENFPEEGELPKKVGQQRAKHFRALKRKPLRGYCWLSERVKGTYFISHYVLKKKDKLDSRDTVIVGNNWQRIEEKEDEC